MVEAKRKLAAILSADVAGYSRLMGADEERTVAALDACRAIFKQAIDSHDGVVIDTAGDSVLATFESVVQAVRCSVEVQKTISESNSAIPEDQRMRYRIGVNLGDVIIKSDGTIYGDGVNVAARLESLAEPGGITVSGTIFDHAENKLPVTFEFSGEQSVKNIAKPVRTYQVNPGSNSVVSPDSDKSLALPDKPSIAVLPFENLSGDADQDYFADGIAEDLITALSRIRWMFVSARNSSFAYRGKSPNIQRIGTELGVRYAVEGSVRTSGNHVWAERYDREIVDLFDLQDEITETLVAALIGEVGEFEREIARRKPPSSLGAWDSYQRGMWHVWQHSAENISEACGLFERAIELDPYFAQAYAAFGYSRYVQVINGYAGSPRECLDDALQLANKAVALDEKESFAHGTLGRVRSLRGEHDEAIATLKTAIDLNPSSVLAHYGLGQALEYSGSLDEAMSEFDLAIRLSLRGAGAWSAFSSRAGLHFRNGNYESAVADARRAIRHSASAFWPHLNLMAALVYLDRLEEARIALEKLLELKPDFSLDAVLAALSPLDPDAQRTSSRCSKDFVRRASTCPERQRREVCERCNRDKFASHVLAKFRGPPRVFSAYPESRGKMRSTVIATVAQDKKATSLPPAKWRW